MNDSMNREAEEAMRRAFGAWMRLRSAIPRGDNEVEREQLIIQAEQIADTWESSPWCEEWQYLGGLVHGWQHAPETMREITAAAQIGETDLIDVEVRSLTQVQLLLDPREAGREGWQRMHDRLSAFHGRVAALDAAVDDWVGALLEAIYDRSVWPADWHQYEHDALTDEQFWIQQERVFDAAFRTTMVTVART